MPAKRPETQLLAEDDFDSFVPEREVLAEFSISEMTMHRWDKDGSLNFPPVIWIRNRKYRSRKQLQAFKQRMMEEGIANRGKLPEQYARANAASQAAKKANKPPAKRAA